MGALLVADKDERNRRQLASLLAAAGYEVTQTDSALKTIHGVMKRTTQVVILGIALGECTSAELIPLLKRCNRDLVIILVADAAPLPLIRKVRKEGIFYHALPPAQPQDEEEIKEVVRCALESLARVGNYKHANIH